MADLENQNGIEVDEKQTIEKDDLKSDVPQNEKIIKSNEVENEKNSEKSEEVENNVNDEDKKQITNENKEKVEHNTNKKDKTEEEDIENSSSIEKKVNKINNSKIEENTEKIQNNENMVESTETKEKLEKKIETTDKIEKKIDEINKNVDEKINGNNKTIKKEVENNEKIKEKQEDKISNINESEGKKENIEINKVDGNTEKMEVNDSKNNAENPADREERTENNLVKNLEEDSLDNKLDVCQELYSKGSRNFLLKNFQEAADQLGEACELFEEIYGSESSELGMPLLLYAKSLISLSLDENKVLDVPDVEEEEEDSEEQQEMESEETKSENTKEEKPENQNLNGESNEKEAQVLSPSIEERQEEKPGTSSKINNSSAVSESKKAATNGEGENEMNEEDEDSDATNLQIAWETLEIAAKIFSKQGISGFPHLAEIHTELGNIQFENEIFEAAREDYGKALRIYQELSVKDHRRVQAEIHYKIGLTFLLEALNQEGAEAFKTACDLLSDEVEEIKNKTELKDSDKNTIKDIEETQQDIMAKIAEIEETRQQVIDEVRAALDKYKSPSKQSVEKKDGSSSSAESSASSSKPNDISHLIKRKKPDTISAETEDSPAKRLNTEKTG